MNFFERAARKQGYRTVAGVDEAGRGPLAGPVVAAACIIPADLLISGVDDSKKLTPQKRAAIFKKVKKMPEVHYAIGIISSEEIDRINIYQATIQAMLQAIRALQTLPEILLIDGMALPMLSIPSQKIVQGDAKSQSIALASIIAKETRDALMNDFHLQWPHYGFNQHKGYGTPQHLEALSLHGPCPIHRRSFEPCKIA